MALERIMLKNTGIMPLRIINAGPIISNIYIYMKYFIPGLKDLLFFKMETTYTKATILDATKQITAVNISICIVPHSPFICVNYITITVFLQIYLKHYSTIILKYCFFLDFNNIETIRSIKD